MPRILHVTYTFGGSWQELQQEFMADAPAIADVPGLRWKIWLVDESTSTAGGTHLFDDAASAQAYLDGPVVAALRSDPGISNVEARAFDVADELSAATRAPLGGAISA